MTPSQDKVTLLFHYNYTSLELKYPFLSHSHLDLENNGKNAKYHLWEQAYVNTQQSFLSMLIQLEAKVACKQWSTILGCRKPESQALGNLWPHPGLWDILSSNCKLHHCTLTASAPWIDKKGLYHIVQLVGKGGRNIFQRQHILPMGSHWALVNKEAVPHIWTPVSMLSCTLKSNIWFCPQTQWDSETTLTWPTRKTPIQDNIWYMGKGKFC